MTGISLSSNTYFSRTISSARLQKLLTTGDRERATGMGVFDQFKDLFYPHEHRKKDFLTALHNHIHNAGRQRSSEAPDLSAVRQIIQSAPFTELEDFFSARDQSGKPLLHVALEKGDSHVIASYKIFLELLPPDQRDTLLHTLLVAADQQGNPGLAVALEHGRADAINAYKSLLELLPPEQRNVYLIEILAAKKQNGDPGLALALKNGQITAILAYQELLKLLTPEQRTNYLEQLLVAKDSQGAPAVVWAIQAGSSVTLTIYKDLFDEITDVKGFSYLDNVLSLIDIVKYQSLVSALKNGDAELIASYACVFDVIPEQLRGKFLTNLLVAKDDQGKPGLRVALENGHADAIAAYTELLKKIPVAQRSACLSELLELKVKNSQQGLFVAFQKGHAEAITAYKGILELLSEDQRAAYLPGLLAAKDGYGNPGLCIAFLGGHAEAITAYKDLLELLSAEQHATHLPGLLAATDVEGNPGLGMAFLGGHAVAITAYKELLELLSTEQRSAHLPRLLAAKDIDERSCLYWALQNGHTEAINAYAGMLAEFPPATQSKVYSEILSTGVLKPNILINHLGNHSQPGFLTSIDKMDNRFATLKMGLMVKVAQTLLDAPSTMQLTTSQAQSLLEMWAINPDYAEHPVIAETINQKVIPLFIAAANIEKVSVSDNLLMVLIDKVKEITQDEGVVLGKKTGTFMLENNGFFVQLMALSANHSDSYLRNTAEALYDQYLALPELAQHTVLLRDAFQCHGIKGSGDDEQENLTPLSDDDPAYLFVQSTDHNSYDGLMLSKLQIDNMLNKNKLCDWSGVGFVTQVRQPTGSTELNFAVIAALKPHTIFPQFPLFRTSFSCQSQLGELNNFFTFLDLKYTKNSSEPNLPGKDYSALFARAITERTSSKKLTGHSNQLRLGKIFNRFLTEPKQQTGSLVALPTLTAAHVEQLLENFKPLEGLASSLHNARVLFCLAAVMAKLSSSSYFGTEYESPTALRTYAAGLLKKAYELDPLVCSEQMYRDSIDKLLGLNGAFTCTAILSTTMMTHAQDQTDFKQILLRIKPIAWS